MSISKGRFVATFAKPGHDIYGRRDKDIKHRWIVFINERQYLDLEVMDWNTSVREFPTFEQAKLWAVARLNELVAEEQKE